MNNTNKNLKILKNFYKFCQNSVKKVDKPFLSSDQPTFGLKLKKMMDLMEKILLFQWN